MSDSPDTVANGASPALPDGDGRLQDLDARVRDFVSERPAVALLAAVGCGFLVGRLLSR